MMNWEQRLEHFNKTAKTYILRNGDVVQAVPFVPEMADEHVSIPVYPKDEYGDGLGFLAVPERYEHKYYWMHPETKAKHELFDGDFLIADDEHYHVRRLPSSAICVWNNRPSWEAKRTYIVLYASDRCNEWESFDEPQKVLDFIKRVGRGRVRLVTTD